MDDGPQGRGEMRGGSLTRSRHQLHGPAAKPGRVDFFAISKLQ
jgi:hypothetical protein